MRYTLYECGPDNLSTYPECWGQAAESPGREIAKARRLADLRDEIDALGHDNWVIRHGRYWIWPVLITTDELDALETQLSEIRD